MKSKYLLIGTLMLLLVLALGACAPAATPEPCPEPQPCPDCPTCPEVPECPECPPPPEIPEPVVKEVPFEELWANSPHNDAEAEAFNHWNEDDPAEVEISCANCHSTQGYIEFVTNGEVTTAPAAPAGTIQCVACHNQATVGMDSVAFPYQMVMEEGGEPENVVVSGLDSSARCMVCHQGRSSKASVDAAIERFGVTEDLDAVPEPVDESTLGFINIHYYPAAATLYGTVVKGGYEYDGKTYDFKNAHVAGYDSCVGCHNPHSLELKLDECAVCHEGVASAEDAHAIRMAGSIADYDGDGDMEEGIDGEIKGLREMLYAAIQAYGSEVAGTAIVYDSHSYPYFFTDTNEDGEPGEDEANYGNRYTAWTGRLLKAAYNYQMATKDPGAFAHGGKYIVQLLYDSIEDINTALSNPVDLSAAHRDDPGHFAGSQEAFRHWDEDGEVSGSCAKCHSAEGLPFFMENGTNIAAPLSNGLACATCHDAIPEYTRYVVDEVEFPSGAVLSFGEANDSNLCLNCHQGRQSKTGLDAYIGEVGDDEAAEGLSFQNPHYFPAGATLFGTDANGAYTYDGNEYVGRNMHAPNFQTCTDCHGAHSLEVKVESCQTCHAGAELHDIRISEGDFDGDGDSQEGMAGEVGTMTEALYAAIQAYTAAQGLPGIVYESHTYPYFFTDTDGDGEAGAGEANYGNQYASWTPRLLKAAMNYQWAQKDPGAFAHNGKFILQVLYDSIADLGGDVSAMTRP
jgi:hypothetical protein